MPEPSDPVRALLEEAGRRALASWRSGVVAVIDKSDGGASPDLVSDADLAANDFITEGLAQLHPGVAMISEETDGGFMPPPPDAFILDPIDGTHNFIAGSDLWTIVLARTRGEEVEEAWIHHPPSGETSHAVRGGPATHAGRPIHVSERDPRRSLVSVSLSTDLLPLLMATDRWAGIRALGSSAWCLAAAARGEFAIHAGGGWPWDVAAGFLIVEQAGGIVRDLEGNRRSPFDHRSKSLSGSPRAVEQALRLFEGA